MSSSSINVQIGAVEKDLELGPSLLQLVAGAFLIAYAGLLPVAGRLVDVGRRRSVFLLGLTLFGVGCAVCAAAPTGWWLVSGRFIQGAGAALSAPAALALITAGLPAGRARNRALGLYSSMGALGFSIGLVLPGFLVAEFGWRASFLVNLPLVAVVLVGGLTVTAAGRQGRGTIHLLPASAITLAMMLAAHAVGGVGVLPPWLAGGELVTAGCLGVLVVTHSRRHGTRTFPVAVVRSPRVLTACVALGGVFAAIVTSMYLAGLVLQVHRGYDAFAVGLALVPQSLSNALVATLGSRLVTRRGAGPVLAVGMSMIAAGLVYLGVAGFDLPYEIGLLPAITVIGAGVALCYPAASIMAVNAVDPEFHGTTAGLLTTFQNVGGATGLAVAAAVAVVPAADQDVGPEPGMYLSAGFLAVAGLVALVLHVRGAALKASK